MTNGECGQNAWSHTYTSQPRPNDCTKLVRVCSRTHAAQFSPFWIRFNFLSPELPLLWKESLNLTIMMIMTTVTASMYSMPPTVPNLLFYVSLALVCWGRYYYFWRWIDKIRRYNSVAQDKRLSERDRDWAVVCRIWNYIQLPLCWTFPCVQFKIRLNNVTKMPGSFLIRVADPILNQGAWALWVDQSAHMYLNTSKNPARHPMVSYTFSVDLKQFIFKLLVSLSEVIFSVIW